MPQLVAGVIALFPRLRAGIFVVVLNANREVPRGLRSPVLETSLVSRTGLLSLTHKDELDLLRISHGSYLGLK